MNHMPGIGMHDDPPPPRSQTGPTSRRVMHSPRFYDALASLMSLGREKQIRETTLELAGVAPGQSVLDVGSGTGTLALAAKTAVGPSGRVSGIDPAPEMVEFAKRKASKQQADVDFRVGAVEALPFRDATFDVVLSSLMLHHLPEKVKRHGFAEIERVLKPGGVFFAVDLATTSPGQLHRIVGRLVGHSTGHTSQADLESATQLLERAGFREVTSGRMKFRYLVYMRGKRPQREQ
jgi:ubiquinone/menaquinone biosynthesis C-methylase UbiE